MLEKVQQEERKSGLRSFLSSPFIYDSFQSIIGGKRARKYVVENYVNPTITTESKMLDIGCGTGYVLDYISMPIDYLGYDLDPTYIDYAKQKYKGRGLFFCERVNEMELKKGEKFDFVLAMGLLHHLDDKESTELFKTAFDVLKKGGNFLTLDGVYTDEQSQLSKYVLKNDRGKHVRTEKAYVKLANALFADVNSTVTDDLFVIPYTACVLVCQK